MQRVAKQLRFPFGGVGKSESYREATYPNDGIYYTPMAVNVIGSCTFSERNRGGSRPGLKAIAGISAGSEGKWLWPNGEEVNWPDGKTMTFIDVNAAATMPDGRRIVNQHETFTIYRDRLVKAEGSVWMASRTSDHGDFDFGGEAEDVTKATAGNAALAGTKGEAITALVPVADARLYIATARQLRVIAGEPTGASVVVSENVGIISRDAWCNADGAVFFMGQNGLYAMGEGSPLLASQQLPEDLKGLTAATLIYDPDRRGIHIIAATDWFYDIAAKAFWPMQYAAAVRPVAGGAAVVDGVNTVVFRCADGVWRAWDNATTTDGGNGIVSSVKIGPFRCSRSDDGNGMLAEVTAAIGRGSSPVTLMAHFANDAETAVYRSRTALPDCEFEVTDGWNPTIRPRRRGAWCVLTLASNGRWAYEGILVTVKTFGRLRP